MLQKTLDLGSQGTSTASLGLTIAQKADIRAIVSSFFHQEPAEEGVDQPITQVNVRELDSIPDIVKSLREFSGSPGEFSSWRKSVDRTLDLFESIKGTSRYFAILHTIRLKVTGDADTALESYRTPLNWGRIKKCLMMHYSDRRDIGTLEYQMTTLWQANRSITEFYRAVYQHLSLILDKVACLDYDNASLVNMTNAYREKALDTFVRGLKGELPRLLAVSAPKSLPEALQICLKLENMSIRTYHAQGQLRNMNTFKPTLNQNNSVVQKQGFFPELANVGPMKPPLPPRFQKPNLSSSYQGFNRGSQHFGQNFRQDRPQFNRNPPHESRNYQGYSANNNQTWQRPQPMDVDQSVQSKHVNYMNRPQLNPAFKRPGGGSFQGPSTKFQRNFHLNTTGTPEPGNIQTDDTHNVEDHQTLEGAIGGSHEIEEYSEQLDREEVGEFLNPYDYGNNDNNEEQEYTLQELNKDLNFFG